MPGARVRDCSGSLFRRLYVFVNWNHSRKRIVHKLALQVLRRETVDDLRRVGNKVLMSNNGGETRSFTSSETTTEEAMGIARPKVDDTTGNETSQVTSAKPTVL